MQKKPNSTKPGKRVFLGLPFPFKNSKFSTLLPLAGKKDCGKLFLRPPTSICHTLAVFVSTGGKAFSVCLGGRERRRAR